MKQDTHLTSQELEQTLELLQEATVAAVEQLFNPTTGTWGVAYLYWSLEDNRPLLVATSYHIRHYIQAGHVYEYPQAYNEYWVADGTFKALYDPDMVLNYFQNLKRLRNLRALID